MPFTPEDTLVIRSREYGDGSEYDMEQSGSSRGDYIPDHYVRRLWRKPIPLVYDGGNVGVSIQFVNKDVDRSVLYSTIERSNVLIVQNGSHSGNGAEIAKVEWAPSGKAKDKSNMTMGTKSGTIKDLLKKSNALSQSRVFAGPDGLEYKWKTMSLGNDPAFPEFTFRTLYAKDSKHPVATTQRLTERDGKSDDPAYPVYIAERGLKMQSFIVATLVIAERLA